ncbi:NPP1 family protein [Streptomyces sp. NPDC001507]|uniref:NPP1 family protein n=1 Tax=Streptomyces sp. NPDC001507 TaxID=3364579 RepID=UPI0036B688DC
MPRTRTRRLGRATAVAGSAAALTLALPSTASAGVLQNLPENDDAAWHQEKLLTWDNMASSLRGILNASDWGDANFPLQDAKFDDHLDKAKPSAIPFDAYA